MPIMFTNKPSKMVARSNDVRELSWMYHGVMCFWFLLDFIFIYGYLWYSSLVINFPRFFKRYFRPMKIILLRYSRSNYQIWLYKLNLMCQELSYQIINISAVNQAVFCYYYKFAKKITEKKPVLPVARNEEMHFFEFT